MPATVNLEPQARNRLIIAGFAGAAVSVILGVYGKVHDPTGEALFTLFFSAFINLKVWFATIAVVLGAFQLLSALRLYGKINIPREAPAWLGTLHRVTGAGAILFTVPVAYHCLWALGFQQLTGRVLVHSLVGCFFYGAFVAKVVVVRSKNTPGWALPVIGGALFTALVVLWLTSALWFFTTVDFPAL